MTVRFLTIDRLNRELLRLLRILAPVDVIPSFSSGIAHISWTKSNNRSILIMETFHPFHILTLDRNQPIRNSCNTAYFRSRDTRERMKCDVVNAHTNGVERKAGRQET